MFRVLSLIVSVVLILFLASCDEGGPNESRHPLFKKASNLKEKGKYSESVKAFEEYAKGTHTLGSIADFLADHGVTTKGTPPAKASVARMLTNRVYLGFTFHKGEYYDGSFAPIISPTLFEAVQKMLAKKSRPRVQKVPNHFPFTQFARCGECGSMITAQYATNRFGTKYTYYRCTKKKGVCRQPYLSSSALISQAKNLLQSVSLPLSEIENMEKQIDINKELMKQILNNYLNTTDDEIIKMNEYIGVQENSESFDEE